MSFPRLRFSEVGATEEELQGLEAHFDSLSPELRQATADRWASVGQGDLAEELQGKREQAEEIVEKLDEKQWTHDETDEVFATKHEAVADAETPPTADPPAKS